MAGTRSARAGVSGFRGKSSDSSPALVRRRNTLIVFQALRVPNPCWVKV